MELQYAPPAKSPSRVFPVILAGAVSTAAALIGVYLLDARADFNIMGWHWNYVIPAGAIIVGLVASSGYGLASYFTGLKIRKGLLWTILLLQLGAYFAAQYVVFAGQGPLVLRGTNHQVTFPEYFDLVARNFAWKDEHSDKPGEALGAAGYFFVLLEIAGFVGGSLIVPGVLMKHPYCELCQIYMKRKLLATIPASVKARKVKKKDQTATAAYTAEQQAAFEQGTAQVNELSRLAGAGDVDGFRRNLESLTSSRKAAAKLPARMTVSLVRCRGCNSGHLDAILVTGQGNQIKHKALGRFDLSPDFVAAYFHPLGAVARAVPVSAQSITPR